ncbi:hypothetical protein D1007_42487 [Hordeum vulgare]|nr:hypothetical protein D1007_42487 [Hordeum vulgare]
MHHFYHITHDKMWKVQFKPQNTWSAEEEHMGIDAIHPPREMWLQKSKQINCRAPLSEVPWMALLTTMLVENLYMVSKKKEAMKEEKKEA